MDDHWVELKTTRQYFQRILAPNAFFIAPSPIMRRLAEQHEVPSERIVDMPYGVPDSLIAKRRPKTFSPLLRIGYIGRLVSSKGVDVLLRAVRSLPKDINCRLLIYGVVPPHAADYAEALFRLGREDSRICFHAPVPQEDLPDVHRDLDLVVIPSLWHENATISLLESLALGTPAVISDVEGMAPFLAEGTTGFRFPPGDVVALADRLAWCAANRDLIRSLSDRCGPLLSIAQQISAVECLYQRLVGGTPAVAGCREDKSRGRRRGVRPFKSSDATGPAVCTASAAHDGSPGVLGGNESAR